MAYQPSETLQPSQAQKRNRSQFPIILCLLALTLAGCGARATSQPGQSTQTLQIDGKTFHLELALTPEARTRGLGGREHIPKDGGMLFVFPEAAKRAFVMRDCLVPIDLIFLDANGRVVRMHQMTVEPNPAVPQTSYSSTYPAQYAIELKGGMLDKLDIQRGDRIAFPRQALKRRAE
jgi:uncharacterized membrane protein (UPF0127 family)